MDQLNSILAAALQELKNTGTYKTQKFNTSTLGRSMEVAGYGKEIVLCSNNYLGLAGKKDIIAAAHQALDRYGAGGASVRFICGTYDIHRQLEETTANFLGMDAAITYSSCWAANTAAIPALLANGGCILSDELNHASIIDGCRLAPKAVQRLVYKHGDMADLEKKLQEVPQSAIKLIITDGVFSMEGDIAKLPEIIHLAEKYRALVMVDESHATGVIGKTGRGTMEYYGLSGGVDIISGTFGKALGGAGGGFVAASKAVCDWLFQKSRPQLFSNALPPVLCAIAMASIQYLDAHPELPASLKNKTDYFRNLLKDAAIDLVPGDSGIIPILVGDTAKAISIAEKMMDKGVFTIGFGYPVVPEGAARVRIQISDALEKEDLDYAAGVLLDTIKEYRPGPAE